jgi:fatty-acyl-CoA synthase
VPGATRQGGAGVLWPGLSYQDVLPSAERLAARLAVLGVQKGDRVVLCMQNCPQLVMAHFAILRANAVVVPVNPMNRAEELKHYITDPDAKVAITTADLAAEWPSAPATPCPKASGWRTWSSRISPTPSTAT